jgi:hypothetical protein
MVWRRDYCAPLHHKNPGQKNYYEIVVQSGMTYSVGPPNHIYAVSLCPIAVVVKKSPYSKPSKLIVTAQITNCNNDSHACG